MLWVVSGYDIIVYNIHLFGFIFSVWISGLLMYIYLGWKSRLSCLPPFLIWLKASIMWNVSWRDGRQAPDVSRMYLSTLVHSGANTGTNTSISIGNSARTNINTKECIGGTDAFKILTYAKIFLVYLTFSSSSSTNTITSMDTIFYWYKYLSKFAYRYQYL